jgi:HK97 family phage major capsid protein
MNPRLRKLYDRRTAIAKEADAILAKADAEDRELTDIESSAIKERTEELAHIDSRIGLEEGLANASAFGATGSRELRPLNELDTTVGGTPTNRQQGSQWSGIGEFLVAVVRAESQGGRGRLDPRLIQAPLATGTGLNEETPADGGFLVEKDMMQGLLMKAFETGILSRRVRRFQIGPGKNGLKINCIQDESRATGSRFGGIQCYWVAEGGQLTASRPKFRPLQIVLNKLTALMYATDELLEDAIALQSVVEQAFPAEFGFTLDDAIFQGLGGQIPLGFQKAPCLVTVAKEGTQADTTVVFENITKMYSRFWSRSKATGNAAWLINQDVMPSLMKMTVGGTSTVFGFPVFIPPGGLANSPFGSLMGLPVIEIEHAATLGSLGDISLVDLTEYAFIEKGGLNMANSMHVRFLYDEMAFRWTYRCNGQPLWNTVLTPYQGSNTISPFVTLASRP